MWKMNGEDKRPFHFTKIGRYWDSKTEIDIAAIDSEGNNLILGECKYWKDKVGINILNELEQKASKVGWKKSERKVWYVLFSANGFTPELEQLAKTRNDIVLAD